MGSDAVAPATRHRVIRTVLGHEIRDPQLMEQACMHASRCTAQTSAADRLAKANERIEFLGDAVLGAALCVILYQRHPDADEGALSRRKGQLASRATLAKLLDEHQLDTICLVGEQLPKPWPTSVKANLMEGILGGIFLDAGFDAMVQAVDTLYGASLHEPLGHAPEDAKTALQEWSLANHQQLPTYTCERSGGSDHSPEFTATVTIGEHTASGTAGSRRRAESEAAAAVLAAANPTAEPLNP